MGEEISGDEARRSFLAAQGVLGASDRRGGVPVLLRRLGAIQLDTISVLARSHELVPYSRLGPVDRATVEAAYWASPHQAFEYWSHAACVLPLEEWPWCERRRRIYRNWKHPRRQSNQKDHDEVRRRLRDLGPLTSKELGGAKAGGTWWSWAPLKIAVEELFNVGEVACVERRGWRRVYDLAERAIPAELREHQPSDQECEVHLMELAARCLGVGTLKDLAEHVRIRLTAARAGAEGAGLVPVRVQGWKEEAWAHPAALDELRAGGPRGRHRTTLLSPFDSLVWDRARTERVFGFAHRLEAYVPAPKRVHGYFVMPLLAGGRLLGRVDPKREGRTLVARQVSLAPKAVEAMAAALVEAAQWVGCVAVALERVDPPELAAPLKMLVNQ